MSQLCSNPLRNYPGVTPSPLGSGNIRVEGQMGLIGFPLNCVAKFRRQKGSLWEIWFICRRLPGTYPDETLRNRLLRNVSGDPLI